MSLNCVHGLQALAETQAHHSQVSSVSQQVDHLQQINENMQSERLELERELEDAREELDSLQAEVERLKSSAGTPQMDGSDSLLLPHLSKVLANDPQR